jgi:hypothetical protein
MHVEQPHTLVGLISGRDVHVRLNFLVGGDDEARTGSVADRLAECWGRGWIAAGSMDCATVAEWHRAGGNDKGRSAVSAVAMELTSARKEKSTCCRARSAKALRGDGDGSSQSLLRQNRSGLHCGFKQERSEARSGRGPKQKGGEGESGGLSRLFQCALVTLSAGGRIDIQPESPHWR